LVNLGALLLHGKQATALSLNVHNYLKQTNTMKRISSANNKEHAYFLDLGSSEDKVLFEHLKQEEPQLFMEAGNLSVMETPSGKTISFAGQNHVLFQPSSHKALLALEKLGLTGGDPRHCPYCNGSEIRHVNSVLLQQLSNKEDVSAEGEKLKLAEFQCHGECGGRSFWV